jgi:hypothetical protein
VTPILACRNSSCAKQLSYYNSKSCPLQPTPNTHEHRPLTTNQTTSTRKLSSKKIARVCYTFHTFKFIRGFTGDRYNHPCTWLVANCDRVVTLICACGGVWLWIGSTVKITDDSADHGCTRSRQNIERKITVFKIFTFYGHGDKSRLM